MGAPEARLALMQDGETFFFSQLDGLDDAALAGPSALPGWSRAHVVAHMAGNGHALCNLLRWARTGIESPMYESTDQRGRDIDMGATQPPDALRTAARDGSARLLSELAQMPDSAWDAEVRTARGRPIPAREVPWMRIRENWIHAVDLASGATFRDFPTPLLAELVGEVASGLQGRADCTPMVIRADRGGRWTIGPDGAGVAAVEVTGPLAAVAGWLLGRDAGAGLRASTGDGRPPRPPTWL